MYHGDSESSDLVTLVTYFTSGHGLLEGFQATFSACTVMDKTANIIKQAFILIPEKSICLMART